MKNIVLLGGSNSVITKGLSHGLCQADVKLSNLALGLSDCTQNLYELKRSKNQKILNESDLIITESNINDGWYNNANLVANKIYYFYNELHKTGKKILSLILPYNQNQGRIINNVHRKCCEIFDFNYIDLDYIYNTYNLYNIYNIRDEGNHQLDILYNILGQNIVAHLDEFTSCAKKALNTECDFKVYVPKENNIIQGDIQKSNISNSIYNESAFRLKVDSILCFGEEFQGYTPLLVHTWTNEGESTKHNDWNVNLKKKSGLKIYNKNRSIVSQSAFMNFCYSFAPNTLIVDANTFIAYNKPKNAELIVDYIDLIGILLAKNYEEKFNINNLEECNCYPTPNNKKNFNHLIPNIRLFTQFLREYCVHITNLEQLNSIKEYTDFAPMIYRSSQNENRSLSYKLGKALIKRYKECRNNIFKFIFCGGGVIIFLIKDMPKITREFKKRKQEEYGEKIHR